MIQKHLTDSEGFIYTPRTMTVLLKINTRNILRRIRIFLY